VEGGGGFTEDEAAKKRGCWSCFKSARYGPGTTAAMGADACVPCVAGKVGNSEGICVDCEAGKYMDHEKGDSVTGCKLCDLFAIEALGSSGSGDLSKKTGYVSAAGASSCTGCAAGKYAQDNACVVCVAGKYSEVAWTECQFCPPGESSVEGSATCTKCAAGKYQVSPSDLLCEDCAVGKYSGSEGASMCTPCGTQRVAPNPGAPACDWCPAGEKGGDAESCTPCAAGTYREAESSLSCIECSPGKVSGTGVVLTHTGASVPQSSTGTSICSECGQNTYDDNNACVDCEAGKNSAAGSAASAWCTYCPPGKSDSGGVATSGDDSQCEVCGAGKYGPLSGGEATTACADCPAGKSTRGNSEQAFCTGCGAGEESALGDSICSPCAANMVSSGSEICHTCEAGKYPTGLTGGPGNKKCSSCEGGKYSEAGATSCEVCEAGKYSPSRLHTDAAPNADCFDCGVGRYSEPDASSCDECDVGKYQAAVAQGACATCAGGETSEKGATVCINCAPGKYSVGDGDCKSCDIGEESEAGATSCSNCPAGKSASPNDESCSECEAGKTSEGGVVCAACSVGKSSSAGDAECEECPSGRYSDNVDVTEATLCKTCPAGEEVQEALSLPIRCTACDEGKTSVPGETCARCDGGFVPAGTTGACIPFPTSWESCALSSVGTALQNQCRYYLNKQWVTVEEGGLSPFHGTCASHTACESSLGDLFKNEDAGASKVTYSIYCDGCEEGYTAYSIDKAKEGTVIDDGLDDDGDASCKSDMNSKPSLCYDPSSFGMCPEGATCKYNYRGGLVTKSGGEESPFSDGSCLEYQVCDLNLAGDSSPVYTLTCKACNEEADFLPAAFEMVSGCGSAPTMCARVAGWDTCPDVNAQNPDLSTTSPIPPAGTDCGEAQEKWYEECTGMAMCDDGSYYQVEKCSDEMCIAFGEMLMDGATFCADDYTTEVGGGNPHAGKWGDEKLVFMLMYSACFESSISSSAYLSAALPVMHGGGSPDMCGDMLPGTGVCAASFASAEAACEAECQSQLDIFWSLGNEARGLTESVRKTVAGSSACNVFPADGADCSLAEGAFSTVCDDEDNAACSAECKAFGTKLVDGTSFCADDDEMPGGFPGMNLTWKMMQSFMIVEEHECFAADLMTDCLTKMKEVMDGFGDDCDGSLDDDCVAEVASGPCAVTYSGDAEACEAGCQTAIDSAWAECDVMTEEMEMFSISMQFGNMAFDMTGGTPCALPAEMSEPDDGGGRKLYAVGSRMGAWLEGRRLGTCDTCCAANNCDSSIWFGAGDGCSCVIITESPTPAPPDSGASGNMTCKYEFVSSWVEKEHGQASPIANCASYKLCDSDEDSFYLQCDECAEGFREGLLSTTSVANHGCGGYNPTVCQEQKDYVGYDWAVCPPEDEFGKKECVYLHEDGQWYPREQSPWYYVGDGSACKSHRLCGSEVNSDGEDTFYIMCQQCGNDYLATARNTDIHGPNCGILGQYPMICEEKPGTASPTSAPTPTPPRTVSAVPTVEPSVPKAGKEAATEWVKENMGATVGISIVAFVAIIVISVKTFSCNPNKFTDEDDDELKNSFDDRMDDEDKLDKKLRKKKEKEKTKKKKDKKKKSRRGGSSEDEEDEESGLELGESSFGVENPMATARGKGGVGGEQQPPPPPVAVAVPVEVKKKKEKPEWTAKSDPNTGQTFYYNRKTKAVSWTPPPEMLGDKAGNAPPPAPAKQFEAHVDPGSGGTYYINISTGESQWDAPPPGTY